MSDITAQADVKPSQHTDESSLESLLGEVAGEFFERMANGERPEIKDYVKRYPEIGEQIRSAFPALRIVGESQAESELMRTDIDGTSQKTIGEFRILHELGRGGMGVVYEAEQLSMRRRVALKVLPFVAIAQEKSIQRFRNEVRAAGSLNHPSIIPIYSVGEERGIHYFAMQLIHGQTMAQVIAQLVHLRTDGQPLDNDSISEILSVVVTPEMRGSGSESTHVFDSDNIHAELPTSIVSTETQPQTQVSISTERPGDRVADFARSAARLGVQAAEALQHAHDRGVLHRDIKPGNLMLDGHGQLYIADFGLAHVETDVGVTMTGDLVGTLRYMSPEQALAKRIVIDHRSDIYSLGATLYELLTLRPPFDAKNRQELLKQIAFEDPPKPRQINRSIPHELETIILKAIEKNADDRYATAGELAADLRAFLEDRSIKAKPPTLIQRSAKWSRRHKPLVWSAGASSALLLVIAVVFLVISNAFISNERDLKIQAMEAQEKALVESDENFKLAVNTVERFTAIVRDDPAFDGPAMQPLRRKLLADALDYYATFVVKRGNDAQPEVEIANAYWTIGQINFRLGDWEESKHAHERAFRIRKQIAQREPDRQDYQVDLAESYSRVAKFHLPGMKEKKLLKAEQFGEEARRIAQRLYDKDASPRHSALLADALLTLGQIYQNQAGAAGGGAAWKAAITSAEDSLERAIAIRKDIVEKKDAAPDQVWAHAKAYRQQGHVALSAGRADTAVARFEQAINIHKKINGAEYDGNHKLAGCLVDLGGIQVTQESIHDQREAGLANIRDALVMCEEQKKAHRLVWPRYMIAKAHNAIGNYHRKAKRWDDAIEADQTAIRELQGIGELGDTSLKRRANLAHNYRTLAQAQFESGNVQSAIASFESGAKEWKQLLSQEPNSPAYSHAYGFMLQEWVQLYERTGKRDDAIRVAWDCARIFARNYAENPVYQQNVVSVHEDLLRLSPDDAVASNRLAWFLATTSNERIRDASRAVKLARSAVEARDENGFFWYTLGIAYYRANDWPQAAEAFSKSVEYRNDTSRGFAGFFIAMNTWQLNRRADALMAYEESAKWMEKQSPNDKELLRFRREAAELLGIKIHN